MLVNLKSQTELSGLYIVYEGSTNLESPGIYGISHLLEHLICKNFEHLLNDFDRDGISWNAYTDSNIINFYFTGLESKLSKYRPLILESISEFNVTKKQFETERKIVLSEYEDYFSEQDESHNLNLFRKLFNDYDPIGLREDLETLKFMDCIKFFELQFMKPSKIINVSKNFRFKDDSFDFSNLSSKKEIKYGKFDNKLELGNSFKDKTSLIFLSPIVESDWSYVNFINAMLSLGLTSPLYSELREKRGLVYSINCYQSRHNLSGLVNISTVTNNKNVEEVIDSVRKTLKKKDKFLNKERLDLIRDYYLVRQQKENILRYNHVSKWLLPQGWSTSDILQKVNLKKLKEVYEMYFDFDSYYVSNDKKEFLS